MEFAPHPENCSQFIDMTGYKFNKFEVIGYAGNLYKKSTWFCKCECGNICKIRSTIIRNEKRKMCNKCNLKSGKNRYTHGGTGTIEYSSYINAKRRCINKQDKNYVNYGGRGIKFKFKTFSHFIDSLGPRPSKKHSIERIDTNGNYEPGNCIWATNKEQSNNKRRNVFLEHDNHIKTIGQWAEEYSIPYSNFYYRYKMGHLDGLFNKVEKYA